MYCSDFIASLPRDTVPGLSCCAFRPISLPDGQTSFLAAHSNRAMQRNRKRRPRRWLRLPTRSILADFTFSLARLKVGMSVFSVLLFIFIFFWFLQLRLVGPFVCVCWRCSSLNGCNIWAASVLRVCVCVLPALSSFCSQTSPHSRISAHCTLQFYLNELSEQHVVVAGCMPQMCDWHVKRIMYWFLISA